MVPGLGESSRVVISGCSSSAAPLVTALQHRGVKDILLVETVQEDSAALQSTVTSQRLGNALGLRLFVTPELSLLPAHLGPMDAVFLTSSPASDHPTSNPATPASKAPSSSSSGSSGSSDGSSTSSPPSAPTPSQPASSSPSQLSSDLLSASLMLRPGAYAVVTTDPLLSSTSGVHRGSEPAETRDRAQASGVSSLPQLATLERPSPVAGCRTDLPLHVLAERWAGRVEGALLQVPPKYAFPAAPLHLEGSVVIGFGRGSRQLGTPTANIDPLPLKQQLSGLPKGGEDISVEVHIMHSYAEDFYGRHLKVVALGYLRPEIRFKGLPALLARIKQDIAGARLQLDDPSLAEFSNGL
ncbi:MAG: hypothetical protein WDW38_008003 [Sanguina aurantia]